MERGYLSKLDLSIACQQFELEELRSTQLWGLYRYERYIFRVSTALRILEKVIYQIFPIADNMIC